MVLHSMVSKGTNKIPHHMALQEVTVDRLPLPLAMNNSLVVTGARLVATVVVVEEVAVVVTTGHKEVVALTAVGEDQVDTGVLVDPTEVVGEEGVTVEAEEEEAVEVVAEMAEEEEDTEVEVVVVEGTAEVLVVETEVEIEEVLVK